MKKIATALALSLGLTSLASADSLNFSFQFSDGTDLAGTLLGNLEANGNTFEVKAVSTLSWNGRTWTDIAQSDIHSVNDFPSYGDQPTVTVDGASGMNIFVCPNSFTDGGYNCLFATEGGFFLSDGGAGAGDGLNHTVSDSFRSAGWHASLSAVPESPAWLMLALGGVVVRLGDKRKRQAV
jgi:hypothetical protein